MRWVRWGSGMAVAAVAAAAALRSKTLGPKVRKAAEETEAAVLSAVQEAGQKAAALAGEMPQAKREQRKRRRRAAAVAGVVLAVVLLLLAGGTWLAAQALAGLQPRLVAAVRDATGRELTLDAPLRWQILPPRVSSGGLSLANLPGGSEPWMLRAGSAELRPDWLPLLLGRVRPGVLRLDRPTLLLERTATGPNWRLPDRTGDGPGVLPPSWRVEARDGLLRLGAAPPFLAGAGLDGATLPVPELTLWQKGGSSALRGAARLGEDGTVALDGAGGTMAALRSATDEPWPVTLSLRTAEGGTASAQGGLVPRTGAWDLRLEAALPALALPEALPPRWGAAWSRPADPAVGGARGTDQDTLRGGAPAAAGLSPDLSSDAAPSATLRDLRASARLTGAGSDRPALSELHAQSGAATAGGALRGLALRDATLDLGEADGPIRLAATGAFGDVPWRLSLLARPEAAGGVALGGVALSGVALSEVRLDSPAGDLSGALAVRWGGRPSVEGSLEGGRLDLDRLLAARRGLASDAAREAMPFGDLAASPASASSPARLFPEAPLPLAALRRLDAALSLRLGRVVLGGAEWRDAVAGLALRDGRLRLGPVGVQAPGGRASATATLDAAAEPPTASLVLEAPSLSLSPLLAALGAPPLASGTLLARARLLAAGASLRALAATLGGELRLALTGGAMRSGALGGVLPGLASGSPGVDAAGGPGTSGPGMGSLGMGSLGMGGLGTSSLDAGGLGTNGLGGGDVLVREMSLALGFQDGRGTLRALSLDSPGLRVTGEGSLDLGDETLRVRLHPRPGPALMVSGRIATPLVAALSPADAGGGAAGGQGRASAALRDAAPGGGFVPLTARNTPSVGVLDRLMRESLGAGD